jgi:hypothetical protein
MQPNKGQAKRLRTVLNNMWAHLDSSGMGSGAAIDVGFLEF